ncbi:Hypothetical predicted protein [Mytilus galloprovincialis]|uniref:DUF5641 domain-containing protein n=1 Tax=Mytilus galloprovincialis TaxID=29158 RepID=A0A8B6FI46_MYTGA|nr:Hypothetical predicted protein [Mytilus galloprovincialis]
MEGENEFGSDMLDFVTRDFYVDDGLTSKPSSAEAIDLMKRTKSALKSIGNFRLHKISSNVEEVMHSFDNEDLAKGLKDLDLSSDILPVQHSLYEIDCIKNGEPLRGNSALLQLSPFIDNEGILCVGGRIKMVNVQPDERNPIIIPSRHWIATLIIRFFHQKIQHQCRQFTSGAIRTGGYWILVEACAISLGRFLETLVSGILANFKGRQKWTQERENIQEGDVVLLKDNQVNRLSWPMGIVTETFPSADNLVRKVEIRIVHTVDKDCVKPAFFVRPVTELVLLSKNL